MSDHARLIRWQGRQALRRITNVARCYDCGREPHGDGVAVRRTADGVAGFAGLVSCGRIWLCPVCNAKVMAQRAIEIGAALTWAGGSGLHVIWGSLTVRHNAADSLADLLELQRSAWRHIMQSRRWTRANALTSLPHIHSSSCELECARRREVVDAGGLGRVGYIRAAEITIGENGWHPHFHPLIFWRGSVQAGQEFADWLAAEWVYAVRELGGEAELEGAQQLTVLDARGGYNALGAYVTKATYDPAKLGLEVVWSQSKVRRNRRVTGTASHWSLLAAVDLDKQRYDTQTGEVGRWWEFEEAVHGHRMITWSRALRSLVGLAEVEQTDEEIAETEIGTVEDTLCFITVEGWMSIRDEPEILVGILTLTAAGGWLQLRELLDLRGIEYYTLTKTA